MNVPLTVMIAVFVLIAVRKIGRVTVRIWHSMTAGALIVLLTGDISVHDALKAIDLDVMVFLAGMFIVGQTLVASGYLYFISYRLFSRIQSVSQLILAVLFGSAFGSALLMNDTLAIIGTPLVLRLAREHKINNSLLLLTLAYAITIGSVMTPIGNPQNLLIVRHAGFASPFSAFFTSLALPSLFNLGLTYLILRRVYRKQFTKETPLCHGPVELIDKKLAKAARLSLILLIGSITANLVLPELGSSIRMELSHIAVLSALPPLLYNSNRIQLLKSLDWPTLVFFASMFVLTASVWQTGVLQDWVADLHVDVSSLPAVLLLSAALSQLISNVPLVALYLPLLPHAHAEISMALAAGSTIAGNFLILGAASNVIIVQHAEKHKASLGFFEFARLGIPLGLLNLLIYGIWFRYGIR
ncbi:SLC13 family permease [Methylosarcina fibrata]|uniref:SLC13 family permease n=1 Tax=Methylosarcina fibrata TaxID=105972 RepID=UPI000476F5B5|nr:SLC13 family permease [Methylosarcina fibrata]